MLLTDGDVNTTVRVDPTLAPGGLVVTLPLAVSSRGDPLEVKNVSDSTNPIIVQPGLGDNIDGAASKTYSGARLFLALRSDGARQWMVVGG